MKKCSLQIHSNITNDNNKNIMPLKFFLKALKFSNVDDELEFDIDDAECIAISLIDQGYIGASIQHSSHTLVFAKALESAFPSMCVNM